MEQVSLEEHTCSQGDHDDLLRDIIKRRTQQLATARLLSSRGFSTHVVKIGKYREHEQSEFLVATLMSYEAAVH